MSERKIVDYVFLHGEPSLIAEFVNDYLKAGFEPFGSHSVCRGTIGQAMVKYEKLTTEE